MDKLVILAEEVASVPDIVPQALASPQLPPALSWSSRILLAPLVLVLPLLSLATIGVWLGTRRREPRVRQAWIHYCCALLVISGIGSSLAAGVYVFFPVAPPPQPAIAFSPEAPVELNIASTEPLSPRDLAKRVEAAVFIVTRDNKSPSKAALASSGFGTGVLLFAGENEYLVATSRHVLDGENWARSAPYKGEAVLWDRAGGFSRAQIAGRHKSLDLMLLRLPRQPGQPRFAQPIIDFEEIAVGERVMVFGHPEGLFFSLSDGLVSRKDPAGQIQITAPVSPGASGGPVYDLRGQLLGIVSSMVNKQHSPNSENLNFAVRADSFLHPGQWQIEEAAKGAFERFAAPPAAPVAAESPESPPALDPQNPQNPRNPRNPRNP